MHVHGHECEVIICACFIKKKKKLTQLSLVYFYLNSLTLKFVLGAGYKIHVCANISRLLINHA